MWAANESYALKMNIIVILTDIFTPILILQVFRPHLYDVFKTIAEVIKKHLDLDQRCDQTTINNDNGLLCPKSRSQGRPIASGNGCKTLVDSMKKVTSTFALDGDIVL